MFLFKVGFNSFIKILSWISSLRLHVLLARIERSSGQTTVLQKSTWSCTAEVWELFLTHFPVNYFNFKDKIKRELRSLLVCNFKCNSCNAEYIGKTKQHYRTRTSEHIGVSPLTEKCVKNNSQTSAVHDHVLFVRQLFVLKTF